ncbi:MAG: PilZ domain-containing protein [Candidatus Omnitrophica bacterium]|nr:PilZ domain-containing protein [Candidatus Omnitrophota bacterium]HOX55083.1 PilZ domain-containing protein [Candidatus Omnitrophota bacterium]
METRKAKRFSVSFKVKIKVDPSSTERFNIRKEEIEAEALDISILGLGLLSKNFIPKGVIIDLKFEINKKVVELRGQIKSAVSGGRGLTRLGVQFVDIDKAQAEIIENFIKDNERRSEPRLELS